MNKLIRIFYEFESLRNSYTGSSTDWLEMHRRIQDLIEKLSKTQIVCSKNFVFYSWIKRRPLNDLYEESSRLAKKCLLDDTFN